MQQARPTREGVEEGMGAVSDAVLVEGAEDAVISR